MAYGHLINIDAKLLVHFDHKVCKLLIWRDLDGILARVSNLGILDVLYVI